MNIVHYGAFLTGPWRRQLEAYKTEGEYNSDIVDVVIFALSNLSARACQLYTVSSGNVKKVHAITPWHPESEAMAKKRPHICLLFKGRHYDALISVNTVSLKKLFFFSIFLSFERRENRKEWFFLHNITSFINVVYLFFVDMRQIDH